MCAVEEDRNATMPNVDAVPDDLQVRDDDANTGRCNRLTGSPDLNTVMHNLTSAMCDLTSRI